MFADEDFVALSRKFVCLRLETYESEENQKRVREVLDGNIANTSFVILSPDGESQLSRGSRSPTMSFSSQKKEDSAKLADVIEASEKILSKYPPRGNEKDARSPDFYSFKQALNVSSADQRLLVLTVAPMNQRDVAQQALMPVANDPEVRGKFHYDTAENSDAEWGNVVTGVQAKTGYFVIHAGEFGLKGKVVGHFPLGSNQAKMQSSLLTLNEAFKAQEEPKDYRQHLTKGRQMKINYSDNMVKGADKDADGVIDKNQRNGNRR
ncbi:hypothetical protein [Rubritalea sp.]|uniref:hypothetical protein n=1 Tax=Rubritalea sp. TaxID=2109375 RepID=UPI003EF589F6